mmetsp:Transcript_25924/g.52832  ORF Transcript_25924/g.52832 Transcript_25924/m.52832 type:complete len:96 (-) Transcript_25924:1716-2003(-)
MTQNNNNTIDQKTAEIDHGVGEKQSRGEKRTKKALESFSFEKINNISRVRFQKTKNIVFAIIQPEIFRSSVHDSFLVFGEARVENSTNPHEKRSE